MKLQARILVFLIPLVCGSLAFVGHFAYSNLRESSLARAAEQVESQLSQLQLALDARRSGVAANMELFASAPLLRDFISGSEFERTNIYQRPLSRLFSTYQDAYPEYSEMAVLGTSGEMLAGVFSLSVTSDMLARFPAEPNTSSTFFIASPAASLLVVRRVQAGEEQRHAYLALLLDLGFLQPLLEASSGAKGIQFVVTDPHGNPLFSSSAQLPAAFRDLPAQADDVAMKMEADAVRVTSRQVFDSLRLMALVSEKTLASGADALATRVFQIIAVVTLLTIALVYVGMRVAVVARLLSLKDAVQHIGAGDLTASVSVGGKDEIAGLAASFEDMRVKLLESQQRLNDYNKTLEQKVAERTQELVDTQQQLVLKEKLASTSVLTAGIAHEINNPVNFIHAGGQNMEAMLGEFRQFVSDLIVEDADPELRKAFTQRFEALHSQLQLVREGSIRIRDIVQNLRVITHLDQNELKPVDVIEGLEKSLLLIEIREGAGIAFERYFSGRPLVMGYGAELNQMFMNILVNACQAITDRRLHDSTAPVGMVRVTASREEAELCITVRDNGCGMSDTVLGRAFDPFFTTRDIGAGTGLGLSMAQAIVHKHDGRLSLQSTPGLGTTVTIWLPVLDE